MRFTEIATQLARLVNVLETILGDEVSWRSVDPGSEGLRVQVRHLKRLEVELTKIAAWFPILEPKRIGFFPRLKLEILHISAYLAMRQIDHLDESGIGNVDFEIKSKLRSLHDVSYNILSVIQDLDNLSGKARNVQGFMIKLPSGMNLGDMAAIVSRLHLALEVPSKEFLDENLQIAYVEAGSIWLGIISSPLVYLVLVRIFNLYKLYSQHRINMEAAARKLTAQSTINSYLDYIKNNVGMQLQLLAESEADEIMEIQERRNKISDRNREERRDKIRTRLISSVESLHDLLKDGVELHSMLDGSPYENSPFKLKYEKNQSEDLDRKNPILQPYSSHKGESFPVADNDTAEQLMPIRAKKEPE